MQEINIKPLSTTPNFNTNRHFKNIKIKVAHHTRSSLSTAQTPQGKSVATPENAC